MTTDELLVFAHIGDLHITDAKQRNFTDLLSIVAQIEVECGAGLDFVVLPGDNADNGLASQYALVSTALKMLSVPVHVIPGDHDMEPGRLAAFYDGLCKDRLPKTLTARGVRCLFLDFSGAGGGGPDFRLGAEQSDWLARELDAARERGETSLVFMHSYPADLRGAGEAALLTRLLASHDVPLVDIGHTHYNELANDGRTIFAATRSTGQIDEGPVGYSIATLDDGMVSWRFKPLDDAFPFVVVTAPADYRLARDDRPRPEGTVEIRAAVFGRQAIDSVSCRVEDGPWMPMTASTDGRRWMALGPLPAQPLVTVTVQATDVTGRPGQHTIRVATSRHRPPERHRDGSDADTIGAWPENGIFGTQLGPNRNGKPSS